MKPLLIGVAMPALACGPAQQAAQTTASEQPKYGGALTVRMPTDMFDFDTTYVGQSTPNSWASGLAHIQLLDLESGPNVGYAEAILKPELAERWEVSPDARSFTFHIRKGVKYADKAPVNGREITAADVKWSFEYISRTGADSKALPKSQGDWMFTALAGIDTPDPYTVAVRYKEPFAPFVYYAASERLNPIYPREIFQQDGSFKSRIVGAGAFQLDEPATQKGARWVFKKNPAYFDAGRPYLDEVRFLAIADDATATAAFQNIDVAVSDLGAIPCARLRAAGFTPRGRLTHSENWVGPGDVPVQFTDDPALAPALERALLIEVGGVPLRVIGRSDLLHEKLRSGTDPARRRSKRLQDLADAQALLEQTPALRAGLTDAERQTLDSLPL